MAKQNGTDQSDIFTVEQAVAVAPEAPSPETPVVQANVAQPAPRKRGRPLGAKKIHAVTTRQITEDHYEAPVDPLLLPVAGESLASGAANTLPSLPNLPEEPWKAWLRTGKVRCRAQRLEPSAMNIGDLPIFSSESDVRAHLTKYAVAGVQNQFSVTFHRLNGDEVQRGVEGVISFKAGDDNGHSGEGNPVKEAVEAVKVKEQQIKLKKLEREEAAINQPVKTAEQSAIEKELEETRKLLGDLKAEIAKPKPNPFEGLKDILAPIAAAVAAYFVKKMDEKPAPAQNPVDTLIKLKEIEGKNQIDLLNRVTEKLLNGPSPEAIEKRIAEARKEEREEQRYWFSQVQQAHDAKNAGDLDPSAGWWNLILLLKESFPEVMSLGKEIIGMLKIKVQSGQMNQQQAFAFVREQVAAQKAQAAAIAAKANPQLTTKAQALQTNPVQHKPQLPAQPNPPEQKSEDKPASAAASVSTPFFPQKQDEAPTAELKSPIAITPEERREDLCERAERVVTQLVLDLDEGSPEPIWLTELDNKFGMEFKSKFNDPALPELVEGVPFGVYARLDILKPYCSKELWQEVLNRIDSANPKSKEYLDMLGRHFVGFCTSLAFAMKNGE